MKLIALTPSSSDENSYMIGRAYSEAVAAAGAVPVCIPMTDDDRMIGKIAQSFDGFLFTGGVDADPALYGEDTIPACGNIDPERDAFELALLKKVLPLRKPVLGICRGVQVLNVAFGGSLWQDINSQVPGSIAHRQKQASRYASHAVHIEQGTLLARILGSAEDLPVNSLHHQAVKTAGSGLVVSASAGDGVIEAVELPGHPFFLGVQWHPERLCQRNDPYAAAIFRAFAEACGEATGE